MMHSHCNFVATKDKTNYMLGMCTGQQRSRHLGAQEMLIKVCLDKGVQPQRAKENKTPFQLCDRSCTVSSKKFWMGEVHGTRCNMSTERVGDTVSPECTGHCAAGSEYCGKLCSWLPIPALG